MTQHTICAEIKFSYVLQAVFADEVLKKFFGQKQRKSGDNFDIEIRDVTAAAKIVNLPNLLKNDLLPVGNNKSGCLISMDSFNDLDDLGILQEHTAQDAQSFIHCDENTLKHKIVNVAGHLVHMCVCLYTVQTTKEYIKQVFNRTEPRQSLFSYINSIFPSFWIPSTFKNLFKKNGDAIAALSICLN